MAFSVFKQIDASLNYRPFTYVERGVARSCKVIDVGNPKGLDGHRAYTKEQLCTGHEQPQVVGVGQTPGLVPAAGLGVGRVLMEVTNVMAIWSAAGGHMGTEKEGTGKRKTQWSLITSQWMQMSDYFNFLQPLWLFTDTLCDAKLLCPRANWTKEEGDCYYKWNALGAVLISSAFSECTEIMNFPEFYTKVQQQSTGRFSKYSSEPNSRYLFDSCWLLWRLCWEGAVVSETK